MTHRGVDLRTLEAQLLHDMRNAATVVREVSSILQDDLETLSPDAIAHLCAMMSRRSDLLVHLLDDLGSSHLADLGALALSRQPVSLAEICDDVLHGRTLPPGVEISLDVPADAMALADQTRLIQIVDNLVINALRYGGPRVTVAATQEDGVVRLSVIDDGPGVPDHLVDSLFEGYSRGESSRDFGGSGLGLLIVRQLAEAMEGSVSYDHHSDTRFTLTLPALPVTQHALLADPAESGHSVAFWTDDGSQVDPLVDTVASYAAHGLTRGEAVVLAATPARLDGVASALSGLGLDLEAAADAGQYVALDADALHHDLVHDDRIDPDAFERLIAAPVRDVNARWTSLRVFGEVVDLYWRRGDDHLALELESCWDVLREDMPFPLMCAYELAPNRSRDPLCKCHDVVVAA